ncbi:MAG: hypothetical protein QOJ21_578 [Solirubrobacteraceae bacterium]|jgi:hypothetical protein|nr:hypothetical protein [Solirubrobacteraceae bacterium]
MHHGIAGRRLAQVRLGHRRGGQRTIAMSRVIAVLVAALALLSPAVASAAEELSTSSRLDDRRFVVSGPRAYDVGTEAGRYPAAGFHTRGEMGGIWSPPLKLLDGIWFGIDGTWLGPATEFTSGYGHVRMSLPGRPGLSIERTEFVPGDARGLLIGLRFTAGDAEQKFDLAMQAHSELMSAYPWGETQPFTQAEFNLADQVAFDGRALLFTEQGPPPVAGADAHNWAAAVGTTQEPTSDRTGDGFRGPQDPAVICPPSGKGTPEQPPRCDDTAYGKGAGGELTYEVTVPAGGEQTVWFGVAGSEAGAEEAKAALGAILADPEAALKRKLAERQALAAHTKLSLPGDPLLAAGIDWSKQNLADSVQEAHDLRVRETNAGTRYPPPAGTVPSIRFLAAGFPDYPWLFATDGEYTAFASVALGQFEPIKDHMRGLRDVSLALNGTSGKVVHEVVSDGTVYFGAQADPGNTDETAKFPSAVALIWRWTGDDAFLREMYAFTVSNMHYIFENLDADRDGWPEGLGNVERPGMGPEKLDNAVYTIRGLWDLADMAAARRDRATQRWAERRARDLTSRFERAWWMPAIPAYADSLSDANAQIQQRHWIGVTPMEAELTRDALAVPGLASADHAGPALDLRETHCYGDDSGLFHTGLPGCDPAPATQGEAQTFTLNTAVMAVGEGNYGRLGPAQQRRFTTANRSLQLPEPDEQPGAMPEIAPSPAYGRSIEKHFTERASVLQAWGAYGTAWPVVHQQLGVRPDLGRGRLTVVPQVPGADPIAGTNIRLGADGSVDVSAQRSGRRYTTTVTANAPVRLRIGHTLPAGARVADVRLDGREVDADERKTNRGLEVTVATSPGAAHTLVVTAR